MSVEDKVRQIIIEMVMETILAENALHDIMEIIRQEQESSYEVGCGEGERRGYERGFNEGRQDAMRNVESNVLGYNGLSCFDRERLILIVRTGSPY